MRFRRPRTALSCAVLAFLAVAVSCQDPTQITVRITTGEPCANLSAVQTIVGPSPQVTHERFKQRYSSGTSDRCDGGGFIGTLVVTPGGDNGSILVAVGVRGADGTPAPDATTCGDAEVAKRCIVARRTFSFIENKPLTLPIHLDPLCIGISCDPASTCFKGGCVPSTVICVDDDCGLAEENPGGGTGVGEGGANDGSSLDGAYDAELDGPGLEDAFDSGMDGATDSMTGTDALVETGGPDASIYPPCRFQNPSYQCYETSGNGYVTAGACDGTPTANMYCCRCNCPSGTTAACSMTMATFSCGGSPSFCDP